MSQRNGEPQTTRSTWASDKINVISKASDMASTLMEQSFAEKIGKLRHEMDFWNNENKFIVENQAAHEATILELSNRMIRIEKELNKKPMKKLARALKRRKVK